MTNDFLEPNRARKKGDLELGSPHQHTLKCGFEVKIVLK